MIVHDPVAATPTLWYVSDVTSDCPLFALDEMTIWFPSEFKSEMISNSLTPAAGIVQLHFQVRSELVGTVIVPRFSVPLPVKV